jgi:hypothetical protein
VTQRDAITTSLQEAHPDPSGFFGRYTFVYVQPVRSQISL